jgi:hypothetical protein
MANQDNRHHCYLSAILSVRTDVSGALSSWKNPLIIFEFENDWQKDYCQGCIYT